MRAEVYPRTDGRYAFRIIANNGRIIATDGGQGYENETDAWATVRALTRGSEGIIDMKKTTTTMYGVARGESIVEDVVTVNPRDAFNRLEEIEGAMRTADLEPDVRLVKVEATTTYSRPHAVTNEELETIIGNAHLEDAGTAGEGAVFHDTGVWGGEGTVTPTDGPFETPTHDVAGNPFPTDTNTTTDTDTGDEETTTAG